MNASDHPIVQTAEKAKTIYEYLATLDERLDGTVLENDWASLLVDVDEALRNPGSPTADALFVALRRFWARPSVQAEPCVPLDN